jgi:type I restriction enzyme S subunit
MNAERLLALYERVAEAPDAIARLRRFILDLAVRGKLVPQDPNDEPASELLKRIAKEKARLGIRNQKVPLKTDEVPFELPVGWSWSRIGEVCSKTGSGSTPRGGKDVYKPSGVPFLRSQNVYDDGLRLNDVAYIDLATHERMSSTRVAPGDLLLNITGGSMGRCCLVPSDFNDANVSQHVAIMRVALKGIEAFLHRLVLSPYFQAFVFDEQTGAGRGGLPKNRMDVIAVALPPIAEQHRIVSKVDELMALCDQLEAARQEREARRDRLAAASLARLNAPDPETFQSDARFALDALPALTTRPNQIKQLRQTILNLAVRGKLVPQDPNDEPASELLQRIAKEKARLVKEGKAKRQDVLPEIDLHQSPFELPARWAWGRFPELGTFGRGKSKHRPRNDPALFDGGEHLMIQTGDVARSQGVIETYTSKYNDFGLSQSFKWPKGTLCITIAANIADSGILSFDACFPDSVVGFVPSPIFENARYFEYFVRTAKANLLEFAPATAQKNINLEILTQVLIPLPPLAEQHRIVAKVDELMVLCDRLEACLTTSNQTRTRLLEATLAEALAPASVSEMEAAE